MHDPRFQADSSPLGMPLAPSFRIGRPNSLRHPRLNFSKCRLPGCFLVDFPRFRDERGLFVKSSQRSAFHERGLECDFTESFYTESCANVLRGMHFQLPPADHAKLVYCIVGEICDVALDLRVGSPTFGQHETYDLRATYNNAAYLPRGIAHGFVVRSASAVVAYQVTSEYSLTHDTGVCWNSFGAEWPCSTPVLSPRDRTHIPFGEFQSPFRFERPTLGDAVDAGDRP